MLWISMTPLALFYLSRSLTIDENTKREERTDDQGKEKLSQLGATKDQQTNVDKSVRKGTSEFEQLIWDC